MKKLYRPVGLREMELIADSGLRSYPPRLPEQRIFYPVLNRAYGIQIASQWNTLDPASGYVGFVTAFDIDEGYISAFEERTVGTAAHRELWVPAGELEEFNRKIIGKIQLTDVFYGKSFTGTVASEGSLRGMTGREQLSFLLTAYRYNAALPDDIIRDNWKVVLLNYGYWRAMAQSQDGDAGKAALQMLDGIRELWTALFPDISLP